MNELSKMGFLTADDIDARIGGKNAKKDKVSLLFYKDARVDMRYLDELYGPGNWQTDYKDIKGVMYCGIGVRASVIDKNLPATEWVWKWNAGVESKGTGDDDPNNQKGEASDAFKRAGFLWGIGRELYNCKGVWVDLTEDEIKGSFVAFAVKEISFDEKGMPTRILVVDHRGNTRYELGKRTQAPKSPAGESSAQNQNNPTPEKEKPVGGAETVAKTDSKAPNNLEEAIRARNKMIYTDLLGQTANEFKEALKCDSETAVNCAKEFAHRFFSVSLSLGKDWSSQVELSRDPEDVKPNLKGRILVNFAHEDTATRWQSEKETAIRLYEMDKENHK